MSSIRDPIPAIPNNPVIIIVKRFIGIPALNNTFNASRKISPATLFNMIKISFEKIFFESFKMIIKNVTARTIRINPIRLSVIENKSISTN